METEEFCITTRGEDTVRETVGEYRGDEPVSLITNETRDIVPTFTALCTVVTAIVSLAVVTGVLETKRAIV
jgi:hypothetical protein